MSTAPRLVPSLRPGNIVSLGVGCLFLGFDALAQPSSSATTSAKDETVVLSPFLVNSSESLGCRATNTISATRVNMPLVTVPQTINVLTTDFLKDMGSFDLNEAAQYVSSVGTTGFARGNFNVRGFAVG